MDLSRFLSASSSGGFNWYGFLIGLGIAACVASAYFTAKKRGIEGDIVLDIIIIGLPLSILFARIYYVIFDIIDGGKWTFSRFIGIDDGGLQGLAIYGACIGSGLCCVIISLYKNRKTLPIEKRLSCMQLLDLVFTFVILGQGVGRWGNFANKEAHGYAITNPSLMWFPMGVEISGTWYYATFFYESMWDIIGFGLLMYIYLGKHKCFDGFNFAFYCAYYGLGRVWIEGMRSDSLWLVPPTDAATGAGGVRVSQLVSGLLILFGVAYIVVHIVRAKRAGKKPFIFANINNLKEFGDDYFDYDKSKLAHPMPDIKSFKDRKNRKKTESEDIIIDESGVAIRAAADDGEKSAEPEQNAEGEKAPENENKKQENRQQDKAEDVYEDRWDD